jgi:RNA 3'-terminal phosphate cyclase (ATP)
VLPALLQVAQPSILTVNGGTHNPHAPPVDFLQQALLPLLKNVGATVELVLKRHGFYPNGGGELVASIEPCAKLQGLELEARGQRTTAMPRLISLRSPSISLSTNWTPWANS